MLIHASRDMLKTGGSPPCIAKDRRLAAMHQHQIRVIGHEFIRLLIQEGLLWLLSSMKPYVFGHEMLA